jgi:hypothetical protein
VLKAIAEKRELTDDIKTKLNAALEQFNAEVRRLIWLSPSLPVHGFAEEHPQAHHLGEEHPADPKAMKMVACRRRAQEARPGGATVRGEAGGIVAPPWRRAGDVPHRCSPNATASTPSM